MERDDIHEDQRRLRRFAECRYVGQGYELRLECPDGPVDDGWVEQVTERFHEQHEREYRRSYRDQQIQIVNVRVRGVGEMVRVAWPELDAPAAGGAARHARRLVPDRRQAALPCRAPSTSATTWRPASA